jgi:predicted Rdx family selenoprotein
MLVTTPTDKWLRGALEGCSSSFSVASPYVGKYLQDAVCRLQPKVKVSLLTRTLLSDFASNASDLEAVHAVAARTGGVFSLSALHAKVYVIDTKRALVTSANATFSGMYRNRECGAEIANRGEVQTLTRLIRSGFASTPKPQLWTVDDLDALRAPVETLRSALPRVSMLRQTAVEAPPRIRLQSRQMNRLIGSFSGWLQLTVEGISQIRSDHFTMDDVFAACAPLAASQFPDNRHVREKLRQQMQRLRDLGLILFLGAGRYELLTRPN